MMKAKLLILIFLTVFTCIVSKAQVILNEISNKNSGQILDEDNELQDWIEIYNPSVSACDLGNYYLSDDAGNPEKWKFPKYSMHSGNYLVVFASGKNRIVAPEDNHWESPILADQTFDYIVPTASTPANWNMPDFAASGWKQGKAGFGYGVNNVSSVVPNGTMAIYVRKSFVLPSGFSYRDIALQLDFDDGVVAYLNGVEISRKNIVGSTTWNSPANAPHESVMKTGGKPELMVLDTAKVRSLLVTGKNVLAVEVHNYIANSNDLNLIPFLSFLISNSLSVFSKTPSSLITTPVINLHTDFKISSKGEEIFLFNKNTNSTESVWVKNLSAGWSLGRIADGSNTWGVFIQPTPAKANTTKSYSTEREQEPVFSVPEGFYPGKQSVSLTTSSETAEIRYTLNGAEPVASSKLYSGVPVSVSVTGVLRAACFGKTGKLPGRSVANTYFINNTKHSIPVLSVITDSLNLYGSNGIFDNWQQEWDKPCYVEYFDANHQKQFEQFSGIQVDGGAGGSREKPQHSFRLEFDNGTYGSNVVDYALIPDRPDRKTYKSVYLRNGSNQWLTFQFKDAMECKMMANHTQNYYSACTPTVVYINGSYFGVYEMREKTNDEFFKENYNASIDTSFNLLSLSYYYNSILRALNGSVNVFYTDYNNFLKLNHTTSDYLKKADQILDLDYYTDYIVAQSWIADKDWPFNNIKIVKGDFSRNRWRFILQDLEWSLNPNGWTDSGFDHIAYMLSYDQNMPYIRFWLELIKDPVYKKRFINRFADIMNSSYLPENTTSIAQSTYDASFSEMRGEYVLWGGGTSQATAQMTQYTNNLSVFKSELTNRSTTVRSSLIKNFGLQGQYSLELQVQPENTGMIQVNSLSPEVFPWTGVYFAGVPIRLEAKGTGNYIFDGWVANNLINDVKNPILETDAKVNGYQFIAKFKLKTPQDAITISEINYSSVPEFPAGDWVELYNYGETSKDLSGWYLTNSDHGHKWVIPGSVVLKPNERLVLASNIISFRSVYPNVANVVGSFGFGLASPADSVLIFNNSGRLIAGVKYSAQLPWPTGAFDKGMTLELKDPNLNLSNPSNWFEGCVGGSPGTAYTKCLLSGMSTTAEGHLASLYPNPATDEIHILLPLGMNLKQISCRIFDTIGKEVKAGISQEEMQNSLRLSVSNLSGGIYIVQLSGGNFQQNLKFIKRQE